MIKFLMAHSKELTIAGALSVLTICYFQQRELTKLRTQIKQPTVNVDSLVHLKDSIQHQLDSLDAEIFPTQIELGRYQVAFTIFAERNPKAAEQYAEIISSETE